MRALLAAFLLAGCAVAPKAALPPVAAARPFVTVPTGGATPCHFSDGSALRACLSMGGQDAIADAPLVLDPGADRIYIAANTTLDGGGLLTLKPSFDGLWIEQPNIIVRGIIIIGPGVGMALDPVALHMVVPIYHSNCATPKASNEVFGCSVGIHIQGPANGVLIDGGTFKNLPQGAVTIFATDKGRPDNITVSNSIFDGGFFAGGAGGQEHLSPMPSPGRVTYAGNTFTGIFRRAPKCEGPYYCEIIGNTWLGIGGSTYPGGPNLGCNGGFGVVVSAGGQALVEYNTVYAGPCTELIANQDFHSADGVEAGKGKVLARNNTLQGGATATGNDKLDFP